MADRYILTLYVPLARLTRSTGAPCDVDGNTLPPGTPPPPRIAEEPASWSPFKDEVQFRTADFLYRQVEMSAANINELMDLWSTSLEKATLDGEVTGPFGSVEHMYATIDATKQGDVPWKCFVTGWGGQTTSSDPTWKTAEYEVWCRDTDEVVSQLLDNPDFDNQFDYASYVSLNKAGKRTWSDFMSGNYSWRHSVSCSVILSIYYDDSLLFTDPDIY